MTEEFIKQGFWNTTQFNRINQDSITDIEEYNDSDKLSLFITQLSDRSAYQQNKLVDKWCSKLPELDKVKYLWLPSRVNQKIFNAICNMPNLEGLWIKWSGIKSIDELINLKKLKHLHLGSSSQINDIGMLSSLPSLKTLHMEQLNKISDFRCIGKLTQLIGLGIDGSIWTPQKIDSLEFIKQISGLRYFTMTNSRLKSKSFEPLLALKLLVRFNSSWNYPESEFSILQTHPSLKYGNIETSWKELKSGLE
ncbi:leucine-rich repeat domain-containing protein [Flagellimonas eckloniae]|nr:leucine-rich repeat domain-containing protein [Allomuricauda eckloniae]